MRLLTFCLLTGLGVFSEASLPRAFTHLNKRAIFGSCPAPVISLIGSNGGQKFASEQPQFKAEPTETIQQTADAICQKLDTTCQVAKDLISQCQASSKAAQNIKDKKEQAEKFNKLMNIGGASASKPNTTSPGGVNTKASLPQNATSEKTKTELANNGTTTGSGGQNPTQPEKGGKNETQTGTGGRNDTQPGENLQKFTGNKGGLPPPVTRGGPKGFLVAGDGFQNLKVALARSCDKQKNTCANQANATGNKELKVSDCETQHSQCIELANNTNN
ncbi:hypothetical protein O181_060099 [Austropuccinia psidii MF-1]|uniref:Uncharacterized protein n=1 Tax=Austropuccinia psidii MF-1 TaxID=1389203 RepID=A0A9Q3EFN1_9BASI|nr:hypothetical protein [Austropuccinia psidii MF-1]